MFWKAETEEGVCKFAKEVEWPTCFLRPKTLSALTCIEVSTLVSDPFMSGAKGAEKSKGDGELKLLVSRVTQSEAGAGAL